MSEAAEKEPTMEEILASIRRIISEDGAGEDVSEPQEPDFSEKPQEEPFAPVASGDSDTPFNAFDEPEPEPQFHADDNDIAAEDDFNEDDVLELTELAEAEVDTDSFTDDDEIGFDQNNQDDVALVSEPTEHQAGASFAELSAMLVGGYEGAGNTLEGLVRDMLKPMLRAWLDENLPRIVEDMVEREIARIAARKGRK